MMGPASPANRAHGDDIGKAGPEDSEETDKAGAERGRGRSSPIHDDEDDPEGASQDSDLFEACEETDEESDKAAAPAGDDKAAAPAGDEEDKAAKRRRGDDHEAHLPIWLATPLRGIWGPRNSLMVSPTDVHIFTFGIANLSYECRQAWQANHRAFKKTIVKAAPGSGQPVVISLCNKVEEGPRAAVWPSVV